MRLFFAIILFSVYAVIGLIIFPFMGLAVYIKSLPLTWKTIKANIKKREPKTAASTQTPPNEPSSGRVEKTTPENINWQEMSTLHNKWGNS